MEQAVVGAIEKYSLIQRGDNVIVALSGGADSMALFHFLVQNSVRLGIAVSAAHFEHGLRGETSLRDAGFVQQACEAYGVPLYLRHGDMGGKKPPKGQSVEEWARKLRYAFFEELAAQHSAKVATAHTLDDNAETVLFHAIRGTGTRGLAGIPPQRGVLVRPLLLASRQQVEAYCEANSLAYVTDESNFSADYARNRLRMAVLPELEGIHSGAKQALSRLAQDMRELDAWLEAQAAQLLDACAVETVFLQGFEAARLYAAPPPVRSKALALLAGRSATHEDIEALVQVAGQQRAAHQLKKGRTARVYNGVLVVEGELPAVEPYSLPFELGEFCLPGGFRIRSESVAIREREVKNGLGREKSDKKVLTFTADYDKITGYSAWRTRQPGDTFAPRGKGTKSLKKWMNEAGVPHSLRYSLPLLANGGKVVWMYGSGFAGGLEVDETTTRLLVLHAYYNKE